MHTLAAPHRHEAEFKRSRFIARAARADTPAQALAFLEEVRDPAATHNCWAYRVGDAYRFSDDGEPGGTAGRPILAAIEGQDLDHTVVVVTRFFGGTKLGAGGLVRAYGGTAASCLRQSRRVVVVPRIEVRVTAPFAVTGALYGVLESQGAARLDETFVDDGVVLTVEIAEQDRASFVVAVRDATRGQAEIDS